MTPRLLVVMLLLVSLAACGEGGQGTSGDGCGFDVIVEEPDVVARELGHEGDWRIVQPEPGSGGFGVALVSPPLLTLMTCGEYASMQAAGPLQISAGGDLRHKQLVTQITSPQRSYSLITFAFLDDEVVDAVELVDTSRDRTVGAWDLAGSDPDPTACGRAKDGETCHGWTILDLTLDDPRVPTPLTGVAMMALTDDDLPGQPAYYSVTSPTVPTIRVALAPGRATTLMIDLASEDGSSVGLEPPIEIPLD